MEALKKMIKILVNKYMTFIIAGLLVGGLTRGGIMYSNSTKPEMVSNCSPVAHLHKEPILEKFDRASIDDIQNHVAKLSDQQKKEVDTIARTIYGEARGEKSDQALMAIAHVILNRVHVKERKWASCPIKVSRQKYQFSCWNKNDPNYKLITKVSLKNRNFRRAYMAALTALNSDDITNGANHYHSVYMRTKPRWAKNKKMIALSRIGNHKFYRA